MSANLEEAIQKKVHNLPDEQQKEVLEFVEGLDESAHRAEVSRFPISAGDGKKKAIDLREQGIDSEQAARLRASFATFEDWNDPAMDIYDDYDQEARLSMRRLEPAQRFSACWMICPGGL